MPFIGKQPAPEVLTASDIADDIITSAKLNYEATLTDGATINWSAEPQDVCKVTLGGNRTLMVLQVNLFQYLLFKIQQVQEL